MSELRGLVAGAARLRRSGTPFLVATLVSVKGSSYRRPGARLLIAEGEAEGQGHGQGPGQGDDDRSRTGEQAEQSWERTVGSVSGGCLEGDLVRRAWWRTENGGTALVTYDSTEDDDAGWGRGFGCNGVVELLLERSGAAGVIDPLQFIGRCIADEQPGVLVTIFRSPRGDLPLGTVLALRADAAPSMASAADGALNAVLVEQARAALRELAPPARTALPGGVEALVEVVRPPPHLFVFGAGPDAVPLVRAARALGWKVTLWTPGTRLVAERRFRQADQIRSGSLAALTTEVARAHRPLGVVMSHNFVHDGEALQMLLATPCPYIGVLGPRRRTEKLLLAHGGDATGEQMRRVHGPAGLAVGAETPDEVALSIVAEAQAVLAGQAGGFLRDRTGAIHAPDVAPLPLTVVEGARARSAE